MPKTHDDILKAEEAKKMVEDGYDQLSDEYTRIRRLSTRDRKYIDLLMERSPKGGRLLDLGCGGGIPSTKELARHFKVVGIDFSHNQIERARKNVPEGEFHRMDMTRMSFKKNSFDAVFSLLAIIHVPREEKAGLFASIQEILKPNGHLLIGIGCDDWVSEPGDDFMDQPMYWSQFGAKKTEAMIIEAGFEIIQATIEECMFRGELERHFFVLAKKI